MTRPNKKTETLNKLDTADAVLSDLVLEAVRWGIPKAHIECIYDVKNKTIQSIRKTVKGKHHGNTSR